MEELIIEGKTHLSSKRAAAITGYAKDYVGQLCREGRVEARLVGRSWYVYEPSIMKHRFDQTDDAGVVSVADEQDVTVANKEQGSWTPNDREESSDKTSIQAVFENTTYESEDIKLIPFNTEEVSPKEGLAEERAENVVEIEDAWKKWFSQGEPATPVQPREANEIDAAEVPIHIMRPMNITTEEKKSSDKTSIQAVFGDVAYESERPLHVAKIQRAFPSVGTIVPAKVAKNRKKKTKEQRLYLRNGMQAGKRGGYLVLKAILVGLMLISASIALIGSGLSGALVGTNGGGATMLGFIEGVSTIIINK